MPRTLTLAATALACLTLPPGTALAADAAVILPWGDWLVALAQTLQAVLSPMLIALVTGLIARFAPLLGYVVSRGMVEGMVARVTDYALNAVEGAAQVGRPADPARDRQRGVKDLVVRDDQRHPRIGAVRRKPAQPGHLGPEVGRVEGGRCPFPPPHRRGGGRIGPLHQVDGVTTERQGEFGRGTHAHGRGFSVLAGRRSSAIRSVCCSTHG